MQIDVEIEESRRLHLTPNPERQMIRAVVRAEVQQKHCDAAN